MQQSTLVSLAVNAKKVQRKKQAHVKIIGWQRQNVISCAQKIMNGRLNEMDKPTYCAECDNVLSTTRKKHPSQWLCIKSKRRDGFGHIDPTWCDEPYMRCIGINGGACPLFTPIRSPEEKIESERLIRSEFEQKPNEKLNENNGKNK